MNRAEDDETQRPSRPDGVDDEQGANIVNRPMRSIADRLHQQQGGKPIDRLYISRTADRVFTTKTVVRPSMIGNKTNGDGGRRSNSDAHSILDTVLNLTDSSDHRRRHNRLSPHSSSLSFADSSSSPASPQSLPVALSSMNPIDLVDEEEYNIDDDDYDGGIDQEGDQSNDLNNSPILTIACGYLNAKLHMDRFYCPGIHQLCIEYDGQFMTPKQFTIVAAKDKQKDWKGAIKINRQPVRILFERNLLDFYKHSEYCSGRCVSKSYKQAMGEQPPDATASSTTTTAATIPKSSSTNGQQQQNSSASSSSTSINPSYAAAAVGFPMVKNEMDDEGTSTTMDDDVRSHHDGGRGSIRDQHRGRTSSFAGDMDVSAVFRHAATTNGNGAAAAAAFDFTSAVRECSMDRSLMQADPVLYWNCVNQLGLFNELTQEIEHQLHALKTAFGAPETRATAAKKLSEMVRILDIGDKIQQKLIAKRTHTNAQCALLATELCELKKIAETQEKKQREVKRKSELLDHLIGSLQNQKRKKSAIASNQNGNGGGESSSSTVEPSPTHALPSP